MSRTIDDVNELLYTQMENLNKELAPKKLEEEIKRTRAMISASAEIGKNLKLKIEAIRVSVTGKNVPEDFCLKPEEKKTP